MLTCCVSLLALPSAVLAFTANFAPEGNGGTSIKSIVEEPVKLTRAISLRSLAKGKLFPFTPAGTPNRPDRSVTVAVRVDSQAAQAITVRGNHGEMRDSELAGLRIAPTAFNLGVSRGYRSFAQELAPAPSHSSMSELPDLKKYKLSPGVKPDDPRFSTRLSVDDNQPAGRAPRTFAGDRGQVDLGGAYRVTDHIDVTAGVRYSQERERLAPVTDGKQDNQAVYVGTQFRF